MSQLCSTTVAQKRDHGEQVRQRAFSACHLRLATSPHHDRNSDIEWPDDPGLDLSIARPQGLGSWQHTDIDTFGNAVQLLDEPSAAWGWQREGGLW